MTTSPTDTTATIDGVTLHLARPATAIPPWIGQREVLIQLATGASNAEISDALYIGAATVKSHVSSILTKLGLRDRAQAVVFAYESGLITPGHHDIGY